MYQIAGAVLIAAAFLIDAIHWTTIKLQHAIIDSQLSGDAAFEKYAFLDEERRTIVLVLLGAGALHYVIGIVVGLRRRRAAPA